MAQTYAYDPLRTFLVDVDFFSGDERFANDIYAIDASNPLSARRRALQLAGDSPYADPRIPDLRRVVHSAELAEGDSPRSDLLVLLADARWALSACIDDLARRTSSDAKAHERDEQERRARYEAVLVRLEGVS